VRQVRRQLLDAKLVAAADLQRARRELGAWSNLDGSFNLKEYYREFADKLSSGGRAKGPGVLRVLARSGCSLTPCLLTSSS
jgi:hypothetical protein